MSWAVETAELIAANSPAAVQAVKQQVSVTLARGPDQELGDRVRASTHFQEGVAAFLQKRRPRYE
jgi:enoyl-CoA hydratase/carnithine racemase